MSDELKKDPQTPEVESTELSGKDLEEVVGGQQKKADGNAQGNVAAKWNVSQGAAA
jgi:hypothetical protein